MAFVERRGDWFRLIFKYGGRRFTHSLHTQDEKLAATLKGSVEKTLLQLQQHLLVVPEGTDLKEFILSGGQVAKPTLPPEPPKEERTRPEPVTFGRIRDRYLETLSIGAVEASTYETTAMHLRHIERTLGEGFALPSLTLADLQGHVNRRSRQKGIRGRPLSPTTIKKEIASLRAAWNWGVQSGLVTGVFPNKGLKYPKTTEKPPFQTWAEIERQMAVNGLSPGEQQDLWDCLFLTLDEVEELLTFVKVAAVQPWVYPLFCFVAHTGARRSEAIRAKLSDLDLDGGSVRIQERKRSHERHTSRRVPLSAFLSGVLCDWLEVHPGGPQLFCQQPAVFRSRKKRQASTPITRDEAHDHFKRTLAESKWKVLRGYHVLRHSFASNCALKGVDQRLINAWLGHQTEEMVQRYRHLFPNQEQQAMRLVFG